jgi:hypothetical protein
LWLNNITERWTREGKFYLCAIEDVFSNRIVGATAAEPKTRQPSRRLRIAADHRLTWAGRVCAIGFQSGWANPRRHVISHTRPDHGARLAPRLRGGARQDAVTTCIDPVRCGFGQCRRLMSFDRRPRQQFRFKG